MRYRACLGSLVALALFGCEAHDARVRPEVAVLPGGAVAVVGDQTVDARDVAAVAAAQSLSRDKARDALVRDAVFAAAAAIDAPADVANARTRVLARAMLHRFADEAAAQPMDATELENWTMARFIDVDRPPGFRVVHAVVLVDANASHARIDAARTHAEAIRAAVEPRVVAVASRPAPSRTGRDRFMERPEIPEDPIAEAFRITVADMAHGDLDTRYEALGVVSEDGRYISYGRSPWERVLDEFARAAARLEKRGELSPIVETQFDADGKKLRGFHVIGLLERTPEGRMTQAERLAFLTPEIHDARARAARKSLLERARARANVVVERNARALLEALRFDANEAATPDEAQ